MDTVIQMVRDDGKPEMGGNSMIQTAEQEHHRKNSYPSRSKIMNDNDGSQLQKSGFSHTHTQLAKKI